MSTELRAKVDAAVDRRKHAFAAALLLSWGGLLVVVCCLAGLLGFGLYVALTGLLVLRTLAKQTADEVNGGAS